MTPAVYGLDAGREHAHRAQRARRLRNRATALFFGTAAIVGSAAIAWVGYETYVEHSRAADLEHQQGVAEMNRKHAGETIDDVIDNLENTPTFNGPGAPALGLAPDTTQP